jgi:hypothetical protein
MCVEEQLKVAGNVHADFYGDDAEAYGWALTVFVQILGLN